MHKAEIYWAWSLKYWRNASFKLTQGQHGLKMKISKSQVYANWKYATFCIFERLFFFSNISRVFKILLFEVKSICWPVWLVDRSVCHNSLRGREVILSCSYRSTCFAFGWLWDTRENARFSEKIMNKRLSSLHNMDAYHATKPYACTIVLQTRTYTCV